MKKVLIVLIAIASVLTACDVLQEVIKETTNINTDSLFENDLLNRFNKKSPISTTFDDAIYEAPFLNEFEPEQTEYHPLDIQPKTNTGDYILRSGVYSMNAQSFCLRGYTHGPSQGDGHLYAPLEGKKADLVQSILERYGNKPEIPQKNVQVLLWAIIAGADMNTLGEQHSKTLNELFTVQELLELQGKDLLSGFADNQLNELRKIAYDNTSPKLRNLIEADSKIRAMVQQNKSFQEIERIAIIAGAAPREDMIREVSKGRWSYHPEGFFVRFFPNGYPQTRVDVYVPYEDDVKINSKGEAVGISFSSDKTKEVIFSLSQMTAIPANRSSQRIGVSPVPVDDINCFEALYSMIPGIDSPIENLLEEVNCSKRKVEWVTDNKISNCNPFAGQSVFAIEYGNSFDENSDNFHCYYVENTICNINNCNNCTEEKIFELLKKNSSYAAPTDSQSPVTNCGVNKVNIPCTSNNPIITTVHPTEKAIINYTVRYKESYSSFGLPKLRIIWHLLHPGAVQRKVFTDGNEIKIATLGEGSGLQPDNNLIYAKRTWGAVDNRLKNEFTCN